eukprot:14051328-Heterocapsa_arctica.AAC.1
MDFVTACQSYLTMSIYSRIHFMSYNAIEGSPSVAFMAQDTPTAWLKSADSAASVHCENNPSRAGRAHVDIELLWRLE